MKFFTFIIELLRHPKRLFLVDSLGAFLTTCIIGFVMVSYQSQFGMPLNIVYPLAFIACCFGLYSAACFSFLENNYSRYLKIIAVANLLYCALTAVLVVKYYHHLTLLGVAYFLLEIVVIVFLAIAEGKAAGIKTDHYL